jgi:hypothetical protein
MYRVGSKESLKFDHGRSYIVRCCKTRILYHYDSLLLASIEFKFKKAPWNQIHKFIVGSVYREMEKSFNFFHMII